MSKCGVSVGMLQASDLLRAVCVLLLCACGKVVFGLHCGQGTSSMPFEGICERKCNIVQKVFVRSKKNALIEVHTQVRLPRTFRRFCGLFAQLLQKLSVRSTNSKERMLKVRCSFSSQCNLHTRFVAVYILRATHRGVACLFRCFPVCASHWRCKRK